MILLQINASDIDGDTLMYSSSSLPTGLSINTATGEITGTVTTVGSSNVTVSVSDGSGISQVSFNWTVTPQVSQSWMESVEVK